MVDREVAAPVILAALLASTHFLRRVLAVATPPSPASLSASSKNAGADKESADCALRPAPLLDFFAA